MAKISEYKVLNISLEEGEEFCIRVPENPKESTVLIGSKYVTMKNLKAVLDAFVDRYPFAFSEDKTDS